MNLLLRGGMLMYVLVIISIAVVAIVVEKYRQVTRVKKANEKLQYYLSQQEKLDNIRAVLRIHGLNSPLGMMLDKLYNAQTDDARMIENSMESTANMELNKLEKGMGWLATLSAIAPLVGFLGTVTGMVSVFMNIQGQGQNSVDINILAGGIWQALLTTVGGLVVGIPAIIFHNDLIQHMENIAKDMQHQGIEHQIRFQKAREAEEK
ncbi:MAG: MotA/TolQ/ExbB proton channel family protein [Candidatus Cloacimonadaceae bacterium]|jgi:biopolymer transport protein ExbB|nr:MotA/TolQ/ExbB proton channel family protein [Candidatus Cloacimonadota bacterium]MDX9949654.1 MotA/TolQ/ExbB proton channel family protein [Candidatus Syntrophosphaera sp.]